VAREAEELREAVRALPDEYLPITSVTIYQFRWLNSGKSDMKLVIGDKKLKK
jgi:hypothetical protein